MFHVALYEPEIPANTGNIGRLCLAAGAWLHLIGALGFRLDDRTLRRAGVDHWRDVEVFAHATLADFEASRAGGRIFCFSVRGRVPYTRVRYQLGDALLFGRESTGLPDEVVERYGERALLIPMPGARARSLNLANAVAIAVYEGLRQVSGG
jgi:tRNA (cytidine/uridine-2'-O-)-methyltransferase